MPKPSERISEIAYELAVKEIDEAIKNPRLNEIRELLEITASNFSEIRQTGIMKILDSCIIFRRSVLQYLDEHDERIKRLERLAQMSKCQ